MKQLKTRVTSHLDLLEKSLKTPDGEFEFIERGIDTITFQYRFFVFILEVTYMILDGTGVLILKTYKKPKLNELSVFHIEEMDIVVKQDSTRLKRYRIFDNKEMTDFPKHYLLELMEYITSNVVRTVS